MNKERLIICLSLLRQIKMAEIACRIEPDLGSTLSHLHSNLFNYLMLSYEPITAFLSCDNFSPMLEDINGYMYSETTYRKKT